MKRAALFFLALLACNQAPSVPDTAPEAVPAASSATVSMAVLPVPPPSRESAMPPERRVSVEVTNIGLHVGGGPNDAPTKAPLLRSVEPHFTDFGACFAKADDVQKSGDFGVDLLVEREGGLAKVTHPRTAITGDAFRSCVVDVFEHVHFQKPRAGKTMASYSLRFTPKS